MRSELRRVKLSEIAANIPNAIAAGPFGSNLVSRDYVDAGVPVIRGQNLAGRWIAGEFVYVSEAKAAQLRTNTARPGDIVFTQRGTLGQVSVVPDGPFQVYVVSQSQMKLTVNTLRADPRYVYYCCTAPDFVAQVHNNAVAAGVPHINLGILRGLEIPFPAISTQVAAAEMLASIDDRIDLLRQTNATLESIAQALFKSWFIDFDPVRAKAEGREPEGMDAATAALFPAEFEESALGLIPRGWKPREIDELADRVGMGPFGSNIKVSTFVDAGVPVLTGACLKGTLLEDDEYRFISVDHAKRLSGSLVGPGDIVVTHRGTLGQVSMIPSGAGFETYVLSQSQFFLRANANLTTPEFLTYFLRSPVGQHLLLANASQVGVPSISRPVTYLKSLRLAAPSVGVARAFSFLINPLHQRTVAGRTQIASLVALRNSLLPRLISGKLRLPEAQEQLEGALA